MSITKAVFIKSSPTTEGVFDDGKPHVAVIGRSNVGKSSTINALTKIKGLAKTSGTPGHTQMITLFLIDDSYYLVDLPGYGFVKGSAHKKALLHGIVGSYLFSPEVKKVAVIIDAKVGPSHDDLAILESLEMHGKDIIVAVNKIDRLNFSEQKKQLATIQTLVGAHPLVPYSAKEGKGVAHLWDELRAR